MKLADKIRINNVSEWLIRRNPIYYSRYKTLFTKLFEADLTIRKKFTNDRLKLIMTAVVPYIQQHHKYACFSDWPLLEKEKIRKHPEKYISKYNLFSISASTGGSSGSPLTLSRSFQSIVLEQAAFDFISQLRGVDPIRSKGAVLRGDTIVPPDYKGPVYWKTVANGRILKLSSHHLTSESIKSYVEVLKEFQPEYIWGYPSTIDFFCQLLSYLDSNFSIPLVLTSSEVLTPASRKQIQETLQCQIVDYYGQAERVAFAYSLSDNQYYFLPGYSLVELHYHSSDNVMDYYEIIGTSLWNTAMPLIRYRTGDLALVSKGVTTSQLEEISYGIRPFFGISGRTSEYLLSPEGQRLFGICQIPGYIQNVTQMQFVQQHKHKVVILLIPGCNYGEQDKQTLLKKAREKIPHSVEIEIKLVEKLNKTKAFKTPLVVREIT